MPVNNKAEAVKYIVDSGTGLMQYKDFERSGKTLQTRIPISVSSVSVDLDDAVECPKLGQDGIQVLESAGYSQEQAQKMLEDGIIEVN